MTTYLENVIVGSGPSAYICALELIRSGQKCTIITPKLSHTESLDASEIFETNKKLFVKDRFTKPWVYEDPEARFRIEGTQTDPIETSALGGLSNIWGAVCFPSPDINTFLPSISLTDIETLLTELKNTLRINLDHSEFWTLYNSKIHSGELFLQDLNPPIAKSANGGPWSVEEEWKLLDKNYVRFQEGFVTAVSKSLDETIMLRIDNTKYKNQTLNCKRVFFACGPFGNARIILNSCPELANIKIQDSAVNYKIFWDLTLRNRFETSMEPKRLFLFSPSGSVSRMEYLQIYNLSSQLIQSFRFKQFHSLLKFCARISAPFISVGLRFQSGEESASITLERKDFGSLLARVNTPNKAMFRGSKFTWRLICSGLIALPFRIKGKPGSGVHSGAFLDGKISGIENALIHKEIDEKNGVFFLGTSGLSQIPAGPVTLLGLLHTLSKTRKVFISE